MGKQDHAPVNDDDKEGSNRASADVCRSIHGGKVLLNGIANQIKIFTYTCSCHPIHSTLHRVLASSNQPKLIRCIIHSNPEHCTALNICARTEQECTIWNLSVAWENDQLFGVGTYYYFRESTESPQKPLTISRHLV